MKLKKLILVSCLLLVAGQIIHAQQSDFPKVTGPYLGQKLPGMTPEIEPLGGFFDRHVQFPTAIDIFLVIYIFPRWIGVNRYKKAHLAATTEKEPLIHNYREVDRVKLPFVFMRNMGSLEPPHGGVVEEVRINVPLDDSLFLPPDYKKQPP